MEEKKKKVGLEKKKKAELILIAVLAAVAVLSILAACYYRSAYQGQQKKNEERISKLAFPYLQEAKSHLKEATISARESNFGNASKALKTASQNIALVLSASGRSTRRRIQQIDETIKKIEKEVAAGKKQISSRVNSAVKIIDEIILPKAKKK